LYRLLALAAGDHGVALNDEALLQLAAHLDVQFVGATNGQACARSSWKGMM
jgi:CMP/dCMP kinase